MKLIMSSSLEVEAYLKTSDAIIIPTGSIEQHGPMGLIGTDMLCAETISLKVAEEVNALVAPTIGYAPAEFNMGFAGTISIPTDLYCSVCTEIFRSLERHRFRHIYVLNGHGANLEPLAKAANLLKEAQVRIKSWWEFDSVNRLRQEFYGDWEGMHATPSEIAITQVSHRSLDASLAAEPPAKLTPDFIKSHAGDKHGPAIEHKARFPDGRVGSHSALANPKQGAALKAAAVSAVAQDYFYFLEG
ncbi:MAG: creatininase family protein [Paracoccaceae bacterium]|nr:creatininase family protein [Paracoccaceae bacterium]